MQNNYNRVFKQPIPSDHIFELLNKISTIDSQTHIYVVNINTYKRGITNSALNDFIELHSSYYKPANIRFITNMTQSYNKFIIALRQMCKSNNIHYTSDIIYSGSTYYTTYYIHKL